jgi:hypothetical protein
MNEKHEKSSLSLALGLYYIIQCDSNMTVTNLCVNKPQSVPVIFEPPCMLSNMLYVLVRQGRKSGWPTRKQVMKMNEERLPTQILQQKPFGRREMFRPSRRWEHLLS